MASSTMKTWRAATHKTLFSVLIFASSPSSALNWTTLCVDSANRTCRRSKFGFCSHECHQGFGRADTRDGQQQSISDWFRELICHHTPECLPLPPCQPVVANATVVERENYATVTCDPGLVGAYSVGINPEATSFDFACPSDFMPYAPPTCVAATPPCDPPVPEPERGFTTVESSGIDFATITCDPGYLGGRPPATIAQLLGACPARRLVEVFQAGHATRACRASQWVRCRWCQWVRSRGSHVHQGKLWQHQIHRPTSSTLHAHIHLSLRRPAWWALVTVTRRRILLGLRPSDNASVPSNASHMQRGKYFFGVVFSKGHVYAWAITRAQQRASVVCR